MKVIIIGGGIKGLSAAWSIQKTYPDIKMTLFEKQNRLGGLIQSVQAQGFFFEKGPRTFQLSRSRELLELINELNLPIIQSSPDAQRRFVLYRGKLRPLGYFLFRGAFSLLKEPWIKAKGMGDESIYAFSKRRFGPFLANTLFDAMTLGIYAGDFQKLSVRACFPTLYRFEKENGSVLKGLLSSPKKKRGLFTLKNGMQSLIDELEKRLDLDIHFNEEAAILNHHEVLAGGEKYSADVIIDATPDRKNAKSLWVVNLGFSSEVLKRKGFGYLVPTQENESILGVVFDSCIFPELEQKTRLTIMLKEETQDPIASALDAIQRHLQIKQAPIYISSYLAKNAIAQHFVGTDEEAKVSVNDCIEEGKNLSRNLK